jgi:hypothetical protein
MTLISRTNCEGLDCAIDRVQKKLYNVLNPVWAGNWDSFPRIYKNKKIDNRGREYFVPEYLDGKYEYTTDTLFNDKVDVTSFFLEGDSSAVDNLIIESDVSLIFSCKINGIYTSSEKEDMKMRGDIFKVIESFQDIWTLEEIHTTVDKVYNEFKKEDLNFSDISERHLLRFDFKVKYNFNC